MSRIYKRCPRCNAKTRIDQNVCPRCELNFSKFDTATNKEAKIAIREGRKEDCILRIGRPSDVSKWKLMIFAVFLGFVGGHNYYIGRYKRGIVFSSFFLVGLINAIITMVVPNINYNSDWWQIFYLFVLGWGAILALWLIDIVKIIFNRFKIPVSRKV